MKQSQRNQLFIGYRWWGAGPEEFAACAGDGADYLHVANLVGVSRRVVARRSVHARYVEHLIGKLVETYDTAIVFTPHVLTPKALEMLRGRCDHLVAWIGDEPTGSRSFAQVHSYFDLVVAPDRTWNQSGAVASTEVRWPYLMRAGGREILVRSGTNTGIAIVGTAYEERVEAARVLLHSGSLAFVIGSGWPKDLPRRKTMPHEQLFSLLASVDVSVVNIPHRQMQETLNPFFFDLGAYGIPQIVVTTKRPRPPVPEIATAENIANLSNDLVRKSIHQTQEIKEWVLSTSSVIDRLETIHQLLSSA